MADLLPAERLRRIEDLVRRHGSVRVPELEELLQISDVTVRRDLRLLERRGVLERTHGGAVAARRVHDEPRHAEAQHRHEAEKRRIGIAAAALVQPGETVFLAGGTTTLEVLRHLVGPEVRVVTNNAAAAIVEPAPDVEVILLGGTLRVRSLAIFGGPAATAVDRVVAARAFIGADGVSSRYGVTCTTPEEAEIARRMIRQTHGQVVLVADRSKLGIVSDSVIAGLDEIDMLVTDTRLDREQRGWASHHAVDTIIAG